MSETNFANIDAGSLYGMINSGQGAPSPGGGFDWTKLGGLLGKMGGQVGQMGQQDQMRRLMMMMQMRGMEGMGQRSPWLGGPPPQAQPPQFPNMGQALMPGRGGY